MTSLFDGRLAPLTFSIGFLDAPPEEVAAVLVEFFTRVHDGGRATELGGSLEENLLELPPLTIGSQPKVLLASTALDGWTAMFDGQGNGQGVAQLTPGQATVEGARVFRFVCPACRQQWGAVGGAAVPHVGSGDETRVCPDG